MEKSIVVSETVKNPLSIQEYNMLHRRDNQYRDAVSVLREVRLADAMRHQKNSYRN